MLSPHPDKKLNHLLYKETNSLKQCSICLVKRKEELVDNQGQCSLRQEIRRIHRNRQLGTA